MVAHNIKKYILFSQIFWMKCQDLLINKRQYTNVEQSFRERERVKKNKPKQAIGNRRRVAPAARATCSQHIKQN